MRSEFLVSGGEKSGGKRDTRQVKKHVHGFSSVRSEMFVELPAKKDFAPLGAKQSFRTYGAEADPNSINMSLLPEQKQRPSFLTRRLGGSPPLLQTVMKILRGTKICVLAL